jgi:positive regulator of sigma E activity
MPLALFLLGYGAAYAAGLSEVACILCSFIGLAIGAALIVILQRRKKKNAISYVIIKLL